MRSAEAAKAGGTVMSLSEVREWVKKPSQVHHVRPASTTEPTPSAGAYPGEDHITFDQCLEMWRTAPPPDGGKWHYRNHYSACQVWPVNVIHEKCTSTGCEEEGTTKFRLTTRGLGWHNKRETTWELKLDEWSTEGEVDDSVPLEVSVLCLPYQPSTVSCTSSNPVVKSITQWQANGTYTQTTVNTISGPESGDAHPEEKRSHYQYQAKVRNTRSLSPQPPLAETVGRCDNASYIRTSPNGGCMFPGTAGILHFNYNDPTYRDSVRFMHTAMHDLGAVKPNSTGLYVPGGYYQQPLTGKFEALTRNYHGKRERGVVRAMCRKLYGKNYRNNPDGPALDCDEYPFSSTYQSGNYDTVGTASTWAVKPVRADHNQQAGRHLGDLLDHDRILDKDAYYVAIDDAP